MKNILSGSSIKLLRFLYSFSTRMNVVLMQAAPPTIPHFVTSYPVFSAVISESCPSDCQSLCGAAAASDEEICVCLRYQILQDITRNSRLNREQQRGLKRHQDVPWNYVEAKKARQTDEKEARSRHSSKENSLILSQCHPNYNKLSRMIWNYYKANKQERQLYADKMKLRDSLYPIIKSIFPYCGLYVVGSSVNGFGSKASDMDLCLMLSHKEINQQREATQILHILQRSLKKNKFLRNIKLIYAKVPILKFTDCVSFIECDLNINNSVSIRNTHLLKSYSSLDARIAPLLLFIKEWAKYENINDASQGTISSYSLVLMVIHYLQCGCTPAVIPSLQNKYPHRFSADIDIRLLTLNDSLPPFVSANQQSVGELFVGFFQYYAEYRYKENKISIRIGHCIPQDPVCDKQFKDNRHPMFIEEPFNLSNTARALFNPVTFEKILRVIRTTNYKLQNQSAEITDILPTIAGYI